MSPRASAAVAELRKQLDHLAQKHKAELNGCLERWCLHLPAVCRCPYCESSDYARQASLVSISPPDPPQPHRVHPVVCSEPEPFREKSGCLDAENLRPDAMVSKVATARRKTIARSQEIVPRETVVEVSVSWLERITSSRKYEVFSGTLIILNALFIGAQTQYVALRAESDARNNRPLQVHTPTVFVALQVAFSLVFSVELGARWVCQGFCGFFRGSDISWNILDVVVVAFSFVDLFLNSLVESGSGSDVLGNITVLRVMRMVRVVRVAKVIRIMRFFRELRMMIFSILGSMKSLVWVVLVLAMTFYLFGLTFTAATTSTLDTLDRWHVPETQDLIAHFGTLDRSLLSLFQSMSGGQDWGMFYDALRTLPAQYRALFLLYITFAIFAVVNIVTGVFVECAMQTNRDDRDVVVQEELEAKKTYLKSMKDVFDEMDADGTGCISQAEFERNLSDERVVAYFNALKLDVSDARTLFRLLDYDQSNEVNIDEFLRGCYRLQGDARSLDMKIMQCEVRFLQERFAVFLRGLQDIQALLAKTSTGCQ